MPGDIRSFKDLDVWKVAMELAVACYDATKAFPRDEQFGMTSQVRRSAVSIAANIAEGHGRSSRPQYAQFVRIARGSLAELEALLLIANRLGYLELRSLDALNELVKRSTAMLVRLAKSLERGPKGPEV